MAAASIILPFAPPPSATRRKPPVRDACGHAVSGASAETVARLDRFAEIILRRSQGGEIALDAAADSPDCPMALAAAATWHLLADTRAGVRAARSLLRRAAALADGVTPREALHLDALAAMADERPHDASLLFLELARIAPGDLCAGYVGQLHCLNHGHFEIMLGLARRLADANPGNCFALGMLSFALDQNGLPALAEEAGEAALAADPTIAWVHHALAHALQSLDRVEQATTSLEAWAPCWDGCGSSMYTHNWWHLMLLRLRAGETGAVLGVYDRQIAPDAGCSTSSFVNASSLLARLELRGVDIEDRWTALADEAQPRIGEHVLPFLDLHYVLALARAGRAEAVAALCASAAAHGAAASAATRQLWREIGVPLIRAVGDYGLGRREAASWQLGALAATAHRIGGSSVQRALLAEIAGAVSR